MRLPSFLLLLLIPMLAVAQTYIPGQTYTGLHGYVSYHAGDLPVIFAAPHGGYLEPPEIPDRTCNSPVLVRDARTEEMAAHVRDQMNALTACHAHIITCHLARTKVDCNRDSLDGACGDTLALRAWTDYQAYIRAAKASVLARYGKGLFIELHGHGHSIQRLELGYLLSAAELRLPDNSLDSLHWTDESSMRNLAMSHPSGMSHSRILRGDSSLGALLHARGYPAVPSPADTAPAPGDAYFSGGFNTLTHGSKLGGSIDGLQIECNFDGVRDSDTNVHVFADSLGLAVLHFLQMHYFRTGEMSNCGLAALEAGAGATLSVWPNPFHDMVHVDCAIPCAWTLRDVNGRVLRMGQGEAAFEIPDLGMLQEGIYLLSTHAEGAMRKIRLIKP